MATMTAPPRERIVEAVAALDAAGMTLFQILGADHPAGEHFIEKSVQLRVDPLGGPTEEDWEPSDPTVVAVEARSNEIEADALELISHNERIVLLRERAADYREQGTTMLNFHTGEKVEWR